MTQRPARRTSRERGSGAVVAIVMFLIVIGAFIFLMIFATAPEDGGGPRGFPGGSGGVGGVPRAEDTRVGGPRPENPSTNAPIIPDGVQPIPDPPPPEAAPREITYRGRITDPLSDAIAAVDIRSGPYPTDDEVRATTDDDGTFAITLPGDVDPVVRMSAPGFYQQIVELEETREDGLPYLLFRGGVVRGVVRGPVIDEDGTVTETPVPDVTLECAGAEGWFAETTTDAEGRYEITAPAGALVVTVRSDAYRDERILDLRADRREETVHDITLTPGVLLDVTLFGVGTAVENSHIRVYTDAGLEGETDGDAMGKASFAGLTPGIGHVVVVAPGYTTEVHELVLGDNRSLIRRAISLEPSAPWTLEVVDAEGNPRPDAQVRISLRHPIRRNIELLTTTAGDKTALDILGPGDTYTIDIGTPHTARARTTFSMKSREPETLRVVLTAGGRIRGKVVDRSGAPIAGVTVLITPTGPDARERGPSRVTTTSLRGAIETERAAPGTYKIQVSHPKLGRVARDVTVIDGEDADLGTIDLQGD